MKKLFALICLLVIVVFCLTGCDAGEIWDDMKTEWSSLMEKSYELHGELISDAVDMNSDILSKVK